MDRYNFHEVESKWQKYWTENESDKTLLDKSKKKFIWDMLEIIL